MAASLFDMCTRTAIQSVNDIRDVSDLPYRLVRPILKKVPNPGQLAEIEEASPQIAEEDAELWHAFIKRDIPNGDKQIPLNTPTDPRKWSKVYRKLKRADQKQQDAAEEALKAALFGKNQEKAKNQTQIIHAVIPQGKSRVHGSGPRAPLPAGAQALKNARTAAEKLKILKRQGANAHMGRSQALSIPSHQLAQNRGTVQQAPRSMMSQYDRRPPTTVQTPKITPTTAARAPVFAPKPSQTSASDRAINAAVIREREEKERRLRALTSGASTTRPASSSTTTSAPAAAARPPHPTAAATAPARKTSPSSAHTAARTSCQPAPGVAPARTNSPPKNMRKRPVYDPFLPAKKRKT